MKHILFLTVSRDSCRAPLGFTIKVFRVHRHFCLYSHTPTNSLAHMCSLALFLSAVSLITLFYGLMVFIIPVLGRCYSPLSTPSSRSHALHVVLATGLIAGHSIIRASFAVDAEFIPRASPSAVASPHDKTFSYPC